MQPLFSFVIPRHCVAAGENGLSPLQEALITHPARIRIASAPTGAGKSYAFQRAVRNGKRVLFIVPTRRLAQNLVASLLESDASSQVALWTSDERERQKAEAPELNVGRLRVRQLRGLEARQDGDIIIATPKSVAWLLLRPSKPGVGEAWAGLPDPIRELDHIVFDEFHSIDARGFGLAAALCRVAGSIAGDHGARITFLSATPTEITRPLVALGAPESAIACLEETVLSGAAAQTGAGRALHGDVAVSFCDAPDMAALAEAHKSEIRACLARKRQAIFVFDALRDLFPAKERLAAFFDRLGVPKEERLSINSADDSSRGGIPRDFCAGRDADPLAAKVLVATSSIEMGVTFRAGLMFMEPGFDTLSFVQRLGRVARGDETGAAIIRCAEQDRRDWLRRLMLNLKKESEVEKVVPVHRFAVLAMASMADRFANQAGDLAAQTPPATFRSMPMRAVWCSALFWAALERDKKLTTGMRRTLESFRPPQAGLVLSLLKSLSESSLHSARVWASAFEAEALRLRSIPQRVLIKEPDGRELRLSSAIFEAYHELVAAPSFLGANDDLVVLVDRPLEDILRDSDRRKVDQRVEALFPHKGSAEYVDARDPSREWLANARRFRDEARGRRPDSCHALEAAIDLVRLSGIVPERGGSATAAENLIV